MTRNPIARAVRNIRPQVVADKRQRERYRVTAEDIAEVLGRCAEFGTTGSMRRHEQSLGFTPVVPGDVPWLSPNDWPEDIIVSLDKHRVRIVSIYTNRPGCGLFSKLVSDIIRAELIPTVIAPLGDMQEILTRWGWHHRIVGMTFDDRYDEWFPTRKWREARIS